MRCAQPGPGPELESHKSANWQIIFWKYPRVGARFCPSNVCQPSHLPACCFNSRTFLEVVAYVWWHSAYCKVPCCSAIELPSTSYPLYDAITDDIVDGGKLSQLQLESVMYASTKHLNFLPSGESKKTFTYNWAACRPCILGVLDISDLCQLFIILASSIAARSIALNSGNLGDARVTPYQTGIILYNQADAE